MCESYRKTCSCGKRTAEIFFGKMALDEQSVQQVYCPDCSRNIATDAYNRVWDNGWVLELDMDVVQARADIMGETVNAAFLTMNWAETHTDSGIAATASLVEVVGPDQAVGKERKVTFRGHAQPLRVLAMAGEEN